MYAWISRHPICATLTIGAVTVVASEVIWFIVKRVRDNIKYKRSQFHEVLIFNELGYTCDAAHAEGTKECDNIHCAQRNIDRMKQLLDQAKYSIDLAMYSLSSQEMLNVLKRALARRVHMRIVMHPKTRELSPEVAILLHMGACIRIVCSERSLMHHKFCVIDGRQRINKLWNMKRLKFLPRITYPAVINGSANWTSGSFGSNFENVIVSTNQIIVTELETEFERMWKVL